MNRLTSRLRAVRASGRLFVLGFLPAGYPGRSGFVAGVAAAFDAGADALEIAIPNPPLPLDGPLIQAAGQQGAAAISGPHEGLRLAALQRREPDQAVVALAYRHAAAQLGQQGLLRTCLDADVDAVLMPEHSFAEQIEAATAARRVGLEQVLFIHLEKDLALLRDLPFADPVVYVQSADLQTGGTFDPAKARERVTELREAMGGRDAHVLVGFGVRGPDEVELLVGTSADGAVIGTTLVAAAGEGEQAVRRLVGSVRRAAERQGPVHA